MVGFQKMFCCEEFFRLILSIPSKEGLEDVIACHYDQKGDFLCI